MGDRIDAKAVLTNEKVQFTALTGGRSELICDYAPPLGDGEGYTGLELLLMSLCVCSGTSVVALLRQMGKKIAKFAVNGSGVRRDAHPTAFETITLQFVLNSDNTAEAEIQKAIQMSRDSICPVWSLVKNNVEITTEHQILPSET